MRYFILILALLLSSCSKSKSVLICGDHECINKSEAKQYFEENLTIEVKITSNERESRFDLVKLNLENNKNDIKVFKNNKNNIIRKLSKEEKIKKKNELKMRKKIAKNKDKIDKIKIKEKKIKSKSKIITKIKSETVLTNDICKNLDKCDIESITAYLIDLSNKKEFPNISKR